MNRRRRRRLAVVEAPTYDRTLLSLKERGAEILAVPFEDDGPFDRHDALAGRPIEPKAARLA